MNFNAFLKYVPQIAQENLLAEIAHAKMVPPERMEMMKKINWETINPRKAAIMMLFYPKKEQTHLILIVRNSYPGVHSSQIAFPGGKVEIYDESLQATALRETHEEIGIPSNKINVIRAFTDVYIPPSNFIVYPFLGYSEEELIFYPDPSEVAGIIELPLKDFLDDSNIVIKRMTTSYTESIDVPAFQIDEHIVWGATAMMLSELKDVLKRVI